MNEKTTRLTWNEYAMALAWIASQRSEDLSRKVGAVAFNERKRVIGTGYNGLAPGKQVDADFWIRLKNDSNFERSCIIHAEINLIAETQGPIHTIAITTFPCKTCLIALIAKQIKRVIYDVHFHNNEAHALLDFYNIEAIHQPTNAIIPKLDQNLVFYNDNVN